jgi:hypothetical protein
MTITVVADTTVGGSITAAATAVSALGAVIGTALPAASAQFDGYTRLSIPAPSFSITAQLAVAAEALATATATLSGMPGGVAAAAALAAGMAAQAAALLTISGSFPSIAGDIESAVASMAGLNCAINAGVVGPNIDLPTITARLGEIGALVASLNAQLAIAAELSVSLNAGGVRVIRFDGDLLSAGAELGAYLSASGLGGGGLGGGGQASVESHFVLMLPTTSGAWTGIQATMAT